MANPINLADSSWLSFASSLKNFVLLLVGTVALSLNAAPAAAIPFNFGTVAAAGGNGNVLGCGGGNLLDQVALAGGAFISAEGRTTGVRTGCSAAGSIDAGGSASANLATGRLKAMAFASGPQNPVFAIPVWQKGNARALMFETIQIVGPPDTTLTFVDAIITVTADGTLSGHSWATLLLNLTTDAGGFSQFSDCATLSAQVAGALTVGCNTLTTNPSPTIVAAGVSRVFLNDPFLRIEAQLDVAAIDLGTANFSQTAQVSITLPDGFSFTSTSGVFLDPAPVPLSKWGARAIILIVMAVGLVSTLGTRRRIGIRRM